MGERVDADVVTLHDDEPVFERAYFPCPLIVVGSVEPSGGYNLAPKHMSTPLGWDGYFGFVCTPKHMTYQNVHRDNCFTVSYPRPEQVVSASLAAASRTREFEKPILEDLETVDAATINGVFLKGAYIYLECELESIHDDFGENSLITGRIVAKHVHEDVLRASNRDPDEMVHEHPLLVYLYPDRYAEVSQSYAFPFPSDFER